MKENERTVAITGIGNATPPFVQEQSKVLEMMSAALQLNKVEKRRFKTMYREAGIQYRHSVLKDFSESKENFSFFPNDPALAFPSTEKRMKIYKQSALPLALKAIEDCFSSLHDFNKNKITHLITVSCTGMSAPGLDIELIESLHLPKTTHRTAVNFMGCYGVFNGIKIAHAICKADKNAKVLLVSVELCTLHFQKNKTIDHLISSAIFSDGAGALVIENTSAFHHNQQFVLNSFYTDILPEGKREMSWEIGDQGFDIQLSSYVPQLIETGIHKFAENLLAHIALTLKDIDYYAIHPGSKRILEACERALNITPNDNQFSYEVLSHYGNMSSATIVFVLKKLWDSLNKIDHKKRALCCAFGPGLTLESMVLSIHHV